MDEPTEEISPFDVGHTVGLFDGSETLGWAGSRARRGPRARRGVRPVRVLVCEEHLMFVAGMAGLLAGSLSMALGEWLSVQSARELYAHQVTVEREELAMVPDEEEEELALIYRLCPRSRMSDFAAAHDQRLSSAGEAA